MSVCVCLWLKSDETIPPKTPWLSLIRRSFCSIIYNQTSLFHVFSVSQRERSVWSVLCYAACCCTAHGLQSFTDFTQSPQHSWLMLPAHTSQDLYVKPGWQASFWDYIAKRLILSRKKLEVLWADCQSVTYSHWKQLSSLKLFQRPQTQKHAQQELHTFSDVRIRVDTRAIWSDVPCLSLYSTVTHLFSVLAVGLHVNIKAANTI